MESKSERFIRLGDKRLEKAVKSIELLVALSDKNRYEYTEKQARYITKTLKDSVNLVERSLKGQNVNNKKISIPKD